MNEKFLSRKFLLSLLLFGATCAFGYFKVMDGAQIERVFIWIGAGYGLANTAPKIFPLKPPKAE